MAHDHHIFRKTGTTHIQSKTDTVAYLCGLHTLRVDTVIILVYVTNIIMITLKSSIVPVPNYFVFFLDQKSVSICRKLPDLPEWYPQNTPNTPNSRANRFEPQYVWTGQT